MAWARWVTEKLPHVGDRIYHREFYVTSFDDRDVKERSYGWGRVVQRCGDPGGRLCMVRFDFPTSIAGERRNWKPRIVWNHDCWHGPEQRYAPIVDTATGRDAAGEGATDEG